MPLTLSLSNFSKNLTMKALTSILFLLLCSLTSFGQDLDITSEVLIRSTSKYEIIGKQTTKGPQY